jgi:hypothetical protein
MKQENKILTQNKLVNLLQESGSDAVSVRLISEWRRRELLPAFDVIGSGRGKSKGREESGWKNPQVIINQTLWILRLRNLYRTLDELYFPLWALGYPIPINRVRQTLSEPLEFMVEDFKELANQLKPFLEPDTRRTDSLIEDIISDTVSTSPFVENLFPFNKVEMPVEALEAGMNIFFNPDYRLNDIGFRYGVADYNKWKKKVRKLEEELQLPEKTEQSVSAKKEDSLDLIFKYAPFIKEHFSLHRLHELMEGCTDQDLAKVRYDMVILAQTTTTLWEVLQILMKDVREDFKPPVDALLPTLFSFGKLIVWLDISLRQTGYADFIDSLRVKIPAVVREELTEEKKQQMAEISPQLAEALEQGLLKLEESFKNLSLTK